MFTLMTHEFKVSAPLQSGISSVNVQICVSEERQARPENKHQ